MVKTRKSVNKKKNARARSHFATADRLRKDDKPEEAIAFYRKAMADDPLWVAPCNDLGVVLRKLGRYEEAVTCLQEGVDRDPRAQGVRTNLGSVLMALNRFEEAEAAHKSAVALAPKDPQPRYHLGLLYKEMERPDLAQEAFERCLEADPENAYYQWERVFSLLKLGDYGAGWQAYECRFRRGKIPVRDYPQPRWDGGDLSNKTILLYPEQGFGDQIQFARFVPELADRGARVVLEAGPELRRLMATLPGLADCIPVRHPFESFDVHAPLLSLPLLLGTQLETLPAKVPYLTAPDRAPLPEIAAAQGLKVGFVWAGSPTHANDRRRSLPLEVFAELFKLPGIDFFSLQMGKQAGQIETLPEARNIVSLAWAIQDFADSAAVISQLDLVITVDTSMAHLAGSLGRPTWVLLPFSGDWRWLMDREDSPWYPTARLFRQPKAGGWPAVVQQLAGALAEARPKRAAASIKAPSSGDFDKHFIVMGMPRSGTSWVRALLDNHPDARCRSEDRFGSLLKRARALIEATNTEVEGLAELGSGPAPDKLDQEDLRQVCRTVIKQTLRKGMKPPEITRTGTRDNSLFFLDRRFFTDMLAGIRIILVVRDPRDVAVSLWFHKCRVEPDFPAQGQDIDNWAPAVAKAWRDRVTYGEGLARALGDRCHVVRYEALHAEPGQEVSRLFEFLGLGASPDLVAVALAASHFTRLSGGRKPGEADQESFYRCGVAGAWPEYLSKETAASFSSASSDLMARYGYPVASD